MTKRILAASSLVMMVIALYYALLVAPNEASMGTVQRIFYFHLPQGIYSYLAAIMLGFGSVMYLVTRDLKWDRFNYSVAEMGVLVTSLSLITGMIWGRPVWNTWWSGDARSNLQLMLALLFIGYLMLRGYLPEREKRARLATVFGFLAALDVPFNYMVTRWVNTLHPQPVLGPGGGGLDPDMYPALYSAFLAFGLLYAYLLMQRLEVARVEDEVEYLEQQMVETA
jgi:heme exporter protein C